MHLNDWGGGVLNEFSVYSFFKKLVDVISIQFWGNELSVDAYFRTFFPMGQMPSYLKEGWVESIEFKNSIIVIRKSANATNDKLGERVVSSTEVIVNSDILQFRK